MPVKARGFLGICQRAGKAVSGDFLIQELLKSKKKIYLLLLAEDASERTKKEIIGRAELHHIDLIVQGTKAELGEAIGKAERAMIAILDVGLSDSLKKSLAE